LKEILRGDFGDMLSAQRFPQGHIVKAGFITIGAVVGPVTIGPLKYNEWYVDERGHQRPVELATLRF